MKAFMCKVIWERSILINAYMGVINKNYYSNTDERSESTEKGSEIVYK